MKATTVSATQLVPPTANEYQWIEQLSSPHPRLYMWHSLVPNAQIDQFLVFSTSNLSTTYSQPRLTVTQRVWNWTSLPSWCAALIRL
jgi:hypothetical protein